MTTLHGCVIGQNAVRCGHADEPVYLEAADLAVMLREAGSTCRTSAAVRAGVREGRLHPTARTVRGSHLWSWDGAIADVVRDDARRRLRVVAYQIPRQLELRLEAA